MQKLASDLVFSSEIPLFSSSYRRFSADLELYIRCIIAWSRRTPSLPAKRWGTRSPSRIGEIQWFALSLDVSDSLVTVSTIRSGPWDGIWGNFHSVFHRSSCCVCLGVEKNRWRRFSMAQNWYFGQFSSFMFSFIRTVLYSFSIFFVKLIFSVLLDWNQPSTRVDRFESWDGASGYYSDKGMISPLVFYFLFFLFVCILFPALNFKKFFSGVVLSWCFFPTTSCY